MCTKVALPSIYSYTVVEPMLCTDRASFYSSVTGYQADSCVGILPIHSTTRITRMCMTNSLHCFPRQTPLTHVPTTYTLIQKSVQSSKPNSYSVSYSYSLITVHPIRRDLPTVFLICMLSLIDAIDGASCSTDVACDVGHAILPPSGDLSTCKSTTSRGSVWMLCFIDPPFLVMAFWLELVVQKPFRVQQVVVRDHLQARPSWQLAEQHCE